MTEAEVAEKKKKIEVHVAEIKRHNGPILIPDDMSTEQAIEVLKRKLVYDDEKVQLQEIIPVFPWDGAIALQMAMEELFGVVLQTVTQIRTMFGTMEEPPAIINVECGPDMTVPVMWGTLRLPGIGGSVGTEVMRDADGRFMFALTATIKHRDEAQVRGLFKRTRELAMTNSLYRGKAFSIKFRAENNKALPIPAIKFPRINTGPVIFNHDLERLIETSILTPIRHTKAVRKAKIPLKRGALLAGPYGTGKTLTAGWVARIAQENGWTFIYVPEVDELAEALRFAVDYQPVVVFAEDIDRAAGMDRTDQVNVLLNALDGVDSKGQDIMTILTSNHADQISEAMKRPGRIDLVIGVEPPDAKAVERLVELYAGDTLAVGENLTSVGNLLQGQIPAVVRECVERSKLEAIRRAGGSDFDITGADLEIAANSIVTERKLFRSVDTKAPSAVELLGKELAPHLRDKSSEKVVEGVAKQLGIKTT